MKLINRIEYGLYILLPLCIIIVSYDVLNNFRIRNNLVLLFCDNTSGNCHFKIQDIYGIFHNMGTFLSLVFGSSSAVFILGQILTFFLYSLIIWMLLFLMKKIIWK